MLIVVGRQRRCVGHSVARVRIRGRDEAAIATAQTGRVSAGTVVAAARRAAQAGVSAATETRVAAVIVATVVAAVVASCIINSLG